MLLGRLGGISVFMCQWQHWTVKTSLCAVSYIPGGYVVRFPWCHTDISLYLPISWLFRMGSHWLHWKAKSSLWALAVSNGGRGDISCPYIFLLVDCFKWVLIWWHWTAKSWLSALAVLNGGRGDNREGG